MKSLIVCGDRHYPYYRVIEGALRMERDQIEAVIEGEARGADILSRLACKVLKIPCIPVKADWEKYGSAAGPLRNTEMKRKLLLYPGVWIEKEVWAFHTHIQDSVGTANMIQQAQVVGVPVRLYAGTKAEDFTYYGTGGKINLCPFCGGEKLHPAQLALRVTCRASFHGTHA